MIGLVIRGAGLGRKLGFPTANLHGVPADLPAGVFRVEVTGPSVDGRRTGVCNVGVRPTLGASGRKVVEVHILDFDGELYGTELAVRFVGKIRDEARFDGLASLRAQIARDVSAARAACGAGKRGFPARR
ncbi:MAG: riboflavin kinase [Elusimicrobia bacterium]|nr:riboflavin kinase [Elusimicrobiota bacterium]